jgi:hypothetical protein
MCIPIFLIAGTRSHFPTQNAVHKLNKIQCLQCFRRMNVDRLHTMIKTVSSMLTRHLSNMNHTTHIQLLNCSFTGDYWLVNWVKLGHSTHFMQQILILMTGFHVKITHLSIRDNNARISVLRNTLKYIKLRLTH